MHPGTIKKHDTSVVSNIYSSKANATEHFLSTWENFPFHACNTKCTCFMHFFSFHHYLLMKAKSVVNMLTYLPVPWLHAIHGCMPELHKQEDEFPNTNSQPHPLNFMTRTVFIFSMTSLMLNAAVMHTTSSYETSRKKPTR